MKISTGKGKGIGINNSFRMILSGGRIATCLIVQIVAEK